MQSGLQFFYQLMSIALIFRRNLTDKYVFNYLAHLYNARDNELRCQVSTLVLMDALLHLVYRGGERLGVISVPAMLLHKSKGEYTQKDRIGRC